MKVSYDRYAKGRKNNCHIFSVVSSMTGLTSKEIHTEIECGRLVLLPIEKIKTNTRYKTDLISSESVKQWLATYDVRDEIIFNMNDSRLLKTNDLVRISGLDSGKIYVLIAEGIIPNNRHKNKKHTYRWTVKEIKESSFLKYCFYNGNKNESLQNTKNTVQVSTPDTPKIYPSDLIPLPDFISNAQPSSRPDIDTLRHRYSIFRSGGGVLMLVQKDHLEVLNWGTQPQSLGNVSLDDYLPVLKLLPGVVISWEYLKTLTKFEDEAVENVAPLFEELLF